MFSVATDNYALSKKGDDWQRQERSAVFSASTVGLVCACLLLMIFVSSGGRPSPADIRRQRDVKLDENGFEICHVPTIQRPEEFFDDIETVTASCDSMVQLGKSAISEVIDSEWGTGFRCNDTGAHFQWICLDKRLNIEPPNCLAYSVGVDPEFTFEHDMERLGCAVHAFDTLKLEDHQRSARIWYQNVRIGPNSFDARHDGKIVEKARNLHQVVSNLGHQHRIIDVLKLDIRDHEWEALNEFVNSEVIDQVKQLVVTLNFQPAVNEHLMNNLTIEDLMASLAKYYELLRMLDCDGFRVFSAQGRGDLMRINNMKRTFHNEYEISYINTNFYH